MASPGTGYARNWDAESFAGPVSADLWLLTLNFHTAARCFLSGAFSLIHLTREPQTFHVPANNARDFETGDLHEKTKQQQQNNNNGKRLVIYKSGRIMRMNFIRRRECRSLRHAAAACQSRARGTRDTGDADSLNLTNLTKTRFFARSSGKGNNARRRDDDDDARDYLPRIKNLQREREIRARSARPRSGDPTETRDIAKYDASVACFYGCATRKWLTCTVNSNFFRTDSCFDDKQKVRKP